MSIKFNRFLATTCLPVIAVAAISSTASYAGFEWTPPANVEPVEVTPEPVVVQEEALQPVTAPVVEEVMPMPADEGLAPIDIKVIENNAEAIKEDAAAVVTTPVEEVAEDVAEDAAENTVENTVEEIIEETATDAPVDNLAQDASAVIEETAEEVTAVSDTIAAQDVVIEEADDVVEDMVESVADDVAETQVVETAPIALDEANASGLELNPFPIEDMNSVTAEKAVVLPSDDNTGLDDLSSEDVIEASDVAEAAEEASVKEEIFWNKPPSFDVIEGFGSDMPLALALRQIVPAHYAYAFGNGVNPGAVISWEGGLPWNEVLKNALEPAGYVYALRGKKLSISKIQTEQAEASDLSASSEAVVLTDDTDSSVDQVIEDVIEIEENAVAEDSLPEDAATLTLEEESHEQSEPASDPSEIIDVIEELSEAPEDVIVEGSETVAETAEEPAIKRGSIVDPGEAEATQPEADMLSDEKKNLASDNTTFDQDVLSADETILSELLPAESDAGVNAEAVTEIKDNIEEPASNYPHEQEDITVIEIPTLEETVSDTDLHDEITEAPLQNDDLSAAVETIEGGEISDVVNDVIADEMTAELIAETNDVAEDQIEDSVKDVVAEEAPQDAFEAISPSEEIVAAQPKAEPSNAILVWEGKKGRSLKSILEKWCASENIELVWDAGANDIDLSSNIFVNGTFKNAVDVLLTKGVSNPPAYEITLDPYQIHIK